MSAIGSRQRSTRDRPAKAPLSAEAVIDAAMAILRSEGLEAVTMRRVATALDTGPASLYVYVSGRDGLLEAIQDRITEGIALEDPDPSRWRAQVHGLLERMREVLIAHPGIAATSMVAPPTTEPALRVLENLLGIVMAGGVNPQNAAWAADMLALLVTYAALEHDVRRFDDGQLRDEVTKTFAGLPPERFPLITAYSQQLVTGSSVERFRFAIDVVLDGVLTRGACSTE